MTLKTKEDVEKYIKENEMDVQSAISNVIAPSIAFGTYANSKKFNGFGFSPMFCYMVKDNLFYQLTPLSGLDGVAKKIADIAINDLDKMKKIVKEHVDIENEIDKIWKGINFRESDEELIGKFKKMLVPIEKWWLYATYGEDKGKRLGELAIEKVMKSRRFNYIKANEVVSILSHPDEKSVFTQERIKFLEICLDLLERNIKTNQISQDKRFDDAYKWYFDEYFFNRTDFNDRRIITKEFFAQEICKEIKDKSKQQVKVELGKMVSDNEKLMNEKAKLNNEIKPTDEERRCIDAVEEMITWLDYRKRDMMKHFYYFFSILHEFSKRAPSGQARSCPRQNK